MGGGGSVAACSLLDLTCTLIISWYNLPTKPAYCIHLIRHHCIYFLFVMSIYLKNFWKVYRVGTKLRWVLIKFSLFSARHFQ